MKDKHKFLNPYYFISLPGKKSVVSDEGQKKITGKITYKMLTKTPIFIPNSSQDKAFLTNVPEHKSYDFYSYRELKEGESEERVYEPVIPGSEVRGMIRSIYEAVTGSCMSIVNDDMVITNRIAPNNAFVPGMIQRTETGLKLIKAEKIHLNKGEVKNYKDGEKLFYSAEKRGKRQRWFVVGIPSRTRSRLNSECGYILRGEPDSKGGREKKICCNIQAI